MYSCNLCREHEWGKGSLARRTTFSLVWGREKAHRNEEGDRACEAK